MCKEVYGSWHSAITSCIIFRVVMVICDHADTHSDITLVLIDELISITFGKLELHHCRHHCVDLCIGMLPRISDQMAEGV